MAIFAQPPEIDGAVGEETTTFASEVLFVLGATAQLAEIGVGYGATQLMVILAAIERALDMLSYRWGIKVE